MALFLSNNFQNISDLLCKFVEQKNHFASRPSSIICESANEILFLKQFFLDQNIKLANIYFFTVEGLVEYLKNQLFPNFQIATTPVIEFFLKNTPSQEILFDNTENLVRQFLQRPLSLTPEQTTLFSALEKKLNDNNFFTHLKIVEMLSLEIDPIFEACVLFGCSPVNALTKELLQKIPKLAKKYDALVFQHNNFQSCATKFLESIFGHSTFLQEPMLSQRTLTTTKNVLETALFISENCESGKRTGIICASLEQAKIIEVFLKARNIHFNSFSEGKIKNKTNSYFYYWKIFQSDGRFKSFTRLLESLHFSGKIGGEKISSAIKDMCRIFETTPIDNVSILQQTENGNIQQIVEKYPFLKNNSTIGEYIASCKTIYPNIENDFINFPKNETIEKESFLKLLTAFYERSLPVRERNFYAKVSVLDARSATKLAFDQIFILDDSNSENNSEKYLPNFYSDLCAQKVTFVSSKIYAPTLNFFKKDQEIRQTAFPSKSERPTWNIIDYFSQNKRGYSSNENIGEGIFHRNSQNYYSFTSTEVKLSATAIERAFSEPDEVWYNHILKFHPATFQFSKPKVKGIFVHNLLKIDNSRFPLQEEFVALIHERTKDFEKILADHTNKIPLLIQECIHPIIAQTMLEKIYPYRDRLPFVASEFNLDGHFTLKSGEKIPLYGRADLILSKLPLMITFSEKNSLNEVLIIDYKTGNMTQKDLQKLSKPWKSSPQNFSGLQLILYGLILRSLGYRNINLLIVNSDPYDFPEHTNLENFINSENWPYIESFLETLLINHQLAFQEKNPFLRKTFSLPLACSAKSGDIL